jgi:transposase
MSEKPNTAIAVIGIDIGKNSFHVVGLDMRGAIALRQKWSRGQVDARLANIPPCLIGMEACVGAHHLSRNALSQLIEDRNASLDNRARIASAQCRLGYDQGGARRGRVQDPRLLSKLLAGRLQGAPPPCSCCRLEPRT